MKKVNMFIAPMASMFLGSALATAPSVDLRNAWKNTSGEFAKAAVAGAGFSFKYDGKTIGPEFPSEWRQRIDSDAKSGVTRTVLTHGSGLVVTREMRVFSQYDAIEYKLRFKNTASKALPPLSALQPLNVAFAESIPDGGCVVSSGGGMADSFLPPRTFAIRKHCLQPTVPGPGKVELTTEGGRSSNRDLPFLFIQNDVLKEGLFVAFGWSGQWGILIQGQAGTLNVRGRIPDVNIALEPGEEIQGPTILVGLYRGALADGSNRLRRLIREQYTPKLAGAAILPMTTYDTYYGLGDQFDEAMLKKVADGAAAIGQEYFLLDAGWFQGENWFTSVGNWEKVARSRLPNGLKPVADHVRSKGMQFGLWFEPERVAEGSLLANAHPDWVLWGYGNAPAPWFGHEPWENDLNADPGLEAYTTKFGVLDYGRPEVQAWVRDMMDRYIRENGVKYIRYDMNLDPLPYWDAIDKPDRRGLTQLKHVEGVYAVIDWIRERHPDVVLEGCSSGGRRIDLETVRRFHTFWISDYTHDPSIIRFHLFGLNHFLPGNYMNVEYSLQPEKNFLLDDLGFQSLFGGAFGTGGHVELWPEAMKEKTRLHTATHKKIRRYLMEDYYPLSAQPGDMSSWSGWQFQDPKDQSGFIQTFRTKTTDEIHRFVIHKLESQARYRFTDAYGEEFFDVKGSTAMTAGVAIKQATMSSRVFTYRMISD